MVRQSQRPDSDIDIMIDIAPDARVGVWDYVGLKTCIADLFAGPVDVVNRDALKPHLRPAALTDAVYAFQSIVRKSGNRYSAKTMRNQKSRAAINSLDREGLALLSPNRRRPVAFDRRANEGRAITGAKPVLRSNIARCVEIGILKPWFEALCKHVQGIARGHGANRKTS